MIILNILNQFKNPRIVREILTKLHNKEMKEITIMEVCGTHTMSILKSGLKDMLPSYIRLISGPGCPVCVTAQGYIDEAIELSKRGNVIITTFGDLIRVPGGGSSLQKEKALGRDIRVVYSPLDSLKIAKENPTKEVVFLGVGFETTAPIIALSVMKAKEEGINNFSVLSSLKTMPKAMEKLILSSEINVDGFICPGHVATVIGVEPFKELSEKYNLPMVVAGFETGDVISAIYKLVEQIEENSITADNLYKRLVKFEGSIRAKDAIEKVFDPSASFWRGLGEVEETGLKFNDSYNEFDGWQRFNIEIKHIEEKKGCICGDILKGLKEPIHCKLFGTACNPSSPVGPCMVSEEGTCAAYFKYK